MVLKNTQHVPEFWCSQKVAAGIRAHTAKEKKSSVDFHLVIVDEKPSWFFAILREELSAKGENNFVIKDMLFHSLQALC